MARRNSAFESLENPLLVGGRNADAGVTNSQVHALGIAFELVAMGPPIPV